MVPFGMGSSMEGHVNAVRGGVSIDLTRMTRVLRVSQDDLDVTVEAGITRKTLDAHLKNTGLMFPIDPGADATIGGMAATRASGTTAVRYGTMRENVLGLTVVLADGRVIRTGSRARKSSAGYDLTRLFVGSEGTLGVITEVTLRLFGRPEALAAAVCPFESMAGAVNTVIQTIQLGIPVARMEVIDETQLAIVNRFSKTQLSRGPDAVLRVPRHQPGCRRRSGAHGGRDRARAGRARLPVGETPEDRARLWQARHDVYYATVASRPGARAMTTDVCVPISQLAPCILETQADARATDLAAPLVGHAGDGNFHLILMLDPDNADEVARVSAFSQRLVERALRLGGTCTGEHGVGLGKMKYLKAEHGEALGVMRAIKQALDPHNLMNPGKMLPEE